MAKQSAAHKRSALLVGQSLNEQQPSDGTAAGAQLPALSDLEVGFARLDVTKNDAT
jgi:hypothetical protein